jgi:hypothetical protein
MIYSTQIFPLYSIIFKEVLKKIKFICPVNKYNFIILLVVTSKIISINMIRLSGIRFYRTKIST